MGAVSSLRCGGARISPIPLARPTGPPSPISTWGATQIAPPIVRFQRGFQPPDRKTHTRALLGARRLHRALLRPNRGFHLLSDMGCAQITPRPLPTLTGSPSPLWEMRRLPRGLLRGPCGFCRLRPLWGIRRLPRAHPARPDGAPSPVSVWGGGRGLSRALSRGHGDLASCLCEVKGLLIITYYSSKLRNLIRKCLRSI